MHFSSLIILFTFGNRSVEAQGLLPAVFVSVCPSVQLLLKVQKFGFACQHFRMSRMFETTFFNLSMTKEYLPHFVVHVI